MGLYLALNLSNLWNVFLSYNEMEKDFIVDYNQQHDHNYMLFDTNKHYHIFREFLRIWVEDYVSAHVCSYFVSFYRRIIIMIHIWKNQTIDDIPFVVNYALYILMNSKGKCIPHSSRKILEQIIHCNNSNQCALQWNVNANINI